MGCYGGGLVLCSARRVGLNEREAPGKVVTARPPERLAQLRSVSHALFSAWRSTGEKRQN